MSERSPFKRGIVRKNDPANGRSKVEFEAEDGVQSFWLTWNSPMTGKSKFFNEPDLGSQVHCVVDWKGEDGYIAGAAFNKEDAVPTSNGRLLKALLEGGLDFEYSKVEGSLTVKLPAGFNIETPAGVSIKGPLKTEGAVTMKGDVAFTGNSVKHNGKNIGDTHIHGGVQPGAANSNVPAN